MKSIKKFEGKKIENMATIGGGAKRYKSFNGNTDKIKNNGIIVTNSSWFRPND